MAGPRKKMPVSDEVFYEYGDISGSEYSNDSEIKVKIS
jgi:hypothetical protein